ncbi:hypothetical protein [Actinomadura rupiterrae]|uniref:hypothetical protein n=1 Tax=Actinomadura rupiterrae TaxID=559627 RepID=UPI0020A4C7D7|nr:hypothetical protein [Actinomadura rupiterrae]MCP2337955.1 hypothetical protein [Actinomadura rupiterrae]
MIDLTRAPDYANHPLPRPRRTAPHRLTSTDGDRRLPAQRLLHSIARPLHCGVTGPFTIDWLRAAFLEALIEDERLPDVVTTQQDLSLMFRDHQAEFHNALGDRLHVFPTLEDSVEHLEAKADDIRAGHTAPITVWITTPGDHTDVIHQTIEYWSGLDLIALLRGHWPHGPNRHPRPAAWPATSTQEFDIPPVAEALTALQRQR